MRIAQTTLLTMSFIYSVIVDLQGFYIEETKQFICKEFAVYNLNTSNYETGIFKQPYAHNFLSEKSKENVRLSVKTHHNLEWCSGDIVYSEHKTILRKALELFEIDKVYVFGEENKKWLNKFINKKIINLEDYKCPPLQELREPIETHYCNLHFNNCAVRNVKDIAKWFKLRFSTYNSIKIFFENGGILKNMLNEEIALLPMDFVMVYASNEISNEWHRFPQEWTFNSVFQTYQTCWAHNLLWPNDNCDITTSRVPMIKDCNKCKENKKL